jgi:tetratricopeptide (TPR) repeat protein
MCCQLSIAQTQPPKKPAKPQEKPPTQKEMDEMLKEMENMYKNMTPEEKRMYDSMGIKFPNSKTIPKLTNKQLADAAMEEGRLLPAKKTALINSLPKTILSNAELAGYIKHINHSLQTKLNPNARKVGDAVLEQYKNDKHYGGMVASTANGMWLVGLKEPAVYLMGKAIELLPNADNYNNFAAYLTMTGAAHIAIPILEKLNSIHKNNSTIYNNLGHAWLELGDETKGEKYLDSAISIYINHPQANFTKALLLEQKGKTKEAAVAVKRSLKHSVTKRKLNKLKELEQQQVKLENYRYPKTYFSTTFNPTLYLESLPRSYAMTAGVEIEKQWANFREVMQQELRKIDAAIKANKPKVEQDVAMMQKKMQRFGGLPPFSPHYMRALATNSKTPPQVQFASAKTEAMEDANYLKEWGKLKSDFSRELEKVLDSIEHLPNGDPLLLNNCKAVVPVVNKHLTLINTLNKNFHDRKLRYWLAETYHLFDYYMSISMTESLALDLVLGLRRSLVNNLLLMKHEWYDLPDCIREGKTAITPPTSKLSDFDEVNCSDTSTLYVPLTGQITIICNRMDVVFNPKLLPVQFSFTSKYYGNDNVITDASIGITVKATDLNISGHFDKDGTFQNGKISIGKNIKGVDISANSEFDANGFTKGSVELGIDGKMGLLPKSITEMAPIELGLKGELGVGMEIGPEGIEDWYVKENTEIEMGASVEADIDKNAKDAAKYMNEIAKEMGLKNVKIPEPKLSTGASISADNRWSVNSGYSVERSSQFSWLKNK